MDTIRLQAMAKINLGLDVTRRRPDGYHDVRMVMQMIRIFDRIDIERISEPEIRLSVNLPFLPADSRNIAYKAARLMLDRYECDGGVIIRIEKHIPVAAGMAGGSTDCAAVLYGINRLFSLGLSKRALMKTGLELGADVPYCLLRHTALAEGIGEILTRIPSLPDCHIVVAKPPLSVSTKKVYRQLQLSSETVHPDIDGMVQSLKDGSLTGVTSRLGNVLEDVTAARHPIINKIKERMINDGALGSLMSGSGPTVFGIFDNKEKARTSYENISRGGLAQQVYLTRPVDFGA